MDTRELYRIAKTSLANVYPIDEAESIARIWLEERLNLGFPQLISGREITEETLLFFDPELKELMGQKPLQYILGHTYFMDLKLFVGQGVLIPRPETEELVDHIIQTHKGKQLQNVVDLCCGSGCIALALKVNLSVENVYAIDLYPAALSLSKTNAVYHKLPVKVLEFDVLTESGLPDYLLGQTDILVSNPPYVTESEKAKMQTNVLAFEPKEALFVPDENPLLFYKAIVGHARQLLKPGGWLYVEINEAFYTQTLALLHKTGFRSISMKEDMQGKPRFIFAQKG